VTHRRALLAAALFVAILAVSTAAPIARLAAQAGVPALAIAFWRMLFSTCATAPLLLGRRGGRWGGRDRAFAAMGGILLAVHFAAWIESLRHTTVAASTVLVSTSPLFGALWAVLFLGEPVTRRQAAGIAIAVLGAAGIALDQGAGGGTAYGNALALLGGAAAGGYWVVGRALRARLSLGAYVTRVYGIAAIALLAAALLRGVPLLGWSAEVWTMFVLLALGPGLLGHTLFNWSLRWLSAPVVSVLTLGEPIGAALLAALLPSIAELPGAWVLAGGIVTLVGIAIAISRP
jgi:drug/metabolite transporter (DMT)-like permease